MKLDAIVTRNTTKTPIIFLHSYPQSAAMWSSQIQEFSEDHQTIAVNFPGYGNSEEPRNGMTVESVAAYIIETLEFEKVSGAIFMGCSMGGYVLFELWRQKPEMIKACIFCDTRAEADTDEGRKNRLAQIEKIRVEGTEFIVEGTPKNLLSEDTVANNPEVVQQVRLWAATPQDSVIICTLQMLADRPDSLSTISTITVPSLVIVGENDMVTPVESAKIIAGGIPNAELVIIPKAGHLSPIESPSEVNKAIRNFIKTL